MSWDNYFLEGCNWVSSKSKDRSTKVGAIIVGPDHEIRSTGCNGFPRGIDDDVEERHNRPLKYDWTEHAERNAIYNAARMGTPLKGCILYCTHEPCVDCSRAIVQSGITKVIVNKDNELRPEHRKMYDPHEAGPEMLIEAGIEIKYL